MNRESNPVNRLLVLTVCLQIGAIYGSILVTHRNFVFDDSFITYRYANNLAEGHGITWNRNEPPVEGYTNFLLVILLAPFIKAGLDPLWTTRVLSVSSALGLSILCYRMTRRYGTGSDLVAKITALAFLPSGMTFYLSTVGLETVIFTFFLFLAFFHLSSFLDTDRKRDLALFGLSQFAAFLLRPEGAILSVLACPLTIVVYGKRKWSGVGGALATLVVTLGLPVITYLVWKHVHFGTLVPTAFYLKANPNGFYSAIGVRSIADYYIAHLKLFCLGLLSLFIIRIMTPVRWFALAMVVLYTSFYVRVDTLMDVHHRFLYPVTPFLFFLAIPLLCLLFRWFFEWAGSPIVKLLFGNFIFAAMFYVSPTAFWVSVVEAVHGGDPFGDEKGVMRQEYRIAQELGKFPDIQNITIALGDAGVIPYFTEARILDGVGLNDGYIARERGLAKVVDYFFSQRPEVVIYGSNKDFTPITYGHGPLGDLSKWSSDARWDEYTYAGTVTTSDARYDMHFLVRKDYSGAKQLIPFLRERVVEVIYDPFPMRIGTGKLGP